MFFPSRASRMSSRSAADPPRVDEPREESTPYQSNTRAIASPSFDCEMMTEIGRRKRQCSIRSRCECQNAKMYCGDRSMFSARTCLTRNVACRPRMKSEPRNARNFMPSPRSVPPRGTADRTASGRRPAAPRALRAFRLRRFLPDRARRSCPRFESSKAGAQ